MVSFLHAAALKFTHPGTGEVMRIEAPMDEGLNVVAKAAKRALIQADKPDNGRFA
ncbi:hypothetical protein ACNKHX_06740 [Shigella flexneri]